jgi:hypothetical protein
VRNIKYLNEGDHDACAYKVFYNKLPHDHEINHGTTYLIVCRSYQLLQVTFKNKVI